MKLLIWQFVNMKNWPFISAYALSLFLGPKFLALTLIGFMVAFKGKWVRMVKEQAFKQLLAWGLTGGTLSLSVQYLWSKIQIYVFDFIPASLNTNQILNTVKSSPGMIVFICLVCPILEEIVFRKMIYDSLKRRIGVLAAASVSAFLFSLIHFDFANLLVYMLIGLIFSWIYIKSKNILASIVAHVLMNSVVLIILM
jgi:uncharacterized protein